MIKSPLRYPGGKSRAIKFLKDYLGDFEEFREPFLGGGSVSFFAVQDSPGCRFLATELYYELYCFWSQLKTEKMRLVDAVRAIRQQYQDGRSLYREIMERREGELSDFQRAVDFFVLNRITFSGVADSGGYSDASFHKRFTDSSIDRLEAAIAIIEQIEITHDDYSLLLNQPGQNVLIFLDPPYYSVTGSKLYGKKGHLHTSFDHARLGTELKNCRHRWLMTYDNCDYIREQYQEFEMRSWQLQYGMNNYKQNNAAMGKEILIANFSLD
ncbi:DNA adenine methylase [Spirulina major]|uniref:DNA adenine methylase n=1 Tax=Spirulina major TaxID=270636 RepID=UPI0009340652|nr:DNA adenine methylase [Spirulina major]